MDIKNNMVAYKFDGTKEGLLTCLHESFVCHEKPFLVTSGDIQLAFDVELKSIFTESEKALKVQNAIIKYGSTSLFSRLFYVLRSGDESKETAIFNIAYECLKNRRDETLNFANPAALLFDDLARKISYEVHRLEGFVRFEESMDGVWYAHFEPDNDICDLLANHFLKRLGTTFILHDVRRNIVAASDGKTYRCFTLNKPLSVYLSPRETQLQELWKTYYNAVNIPQRKNIRLMREYMPVRYHKHMTEKKPEKMVFGGNAKPFENTAPQSPFKCTDKIKKIGKNR